MATLEAQQLCSELGRGHLKFEISLGKTDFITNTTRDTPSVVITIIDPSSSLEVVITADEFDIAILQVRRGHTMVMIHIGIGDDFVLPDEYDPSFAFFQIPKRIAQAYARWEPLYYGLGLPYEDEGEDYEEIVLRTPKDGSGGVLRYRWTLSEGTDKDKLMTEAEERTPPSEGGDARSWLDANWPFELEILSAQNLPMLCTEAWVEFEMNGEMREAPAHFVMDDPELHGKNMPTSSPVFSDASMPYKTDFGGKDVDVDLADWLDKISDNRYHGVLLAVMGIPFVRVPDDKITVVGGVFQTPLTRALENNSVVVVHPDDTHVVKQHMSGDELSSLEGTLSEAEMKLAAQIATEHTVATADSVGGGGGCCILA